MKILDIGSILLLILTCVGTGCKTEKSPVSSAKNTGDEVAKNPCERFANLEEAKSCEYGIAMIQVIDIQNNNAVNTACEEKYRGPALAQICMDSAGSYLQGLTCSRGFIESKNGKFAREVCEDIESRLEDALLSDALDSSLGLDQIGKIELAQFRTTLENIACKSSIRIRQTLCLNLIDERFPFITFVETTNDRGLVNREGANVDLATKPYKSFNCKTRFIPSCFSPDSGESDTILGPKPTAVTVRSVDYYSKFASFGIESVTLFDESKMKPSPEIRHCLYLFFTGSHVACVVREQDIVTISLKP
jgi:hypothetical protein